MSARSKGSSRLAGSRTSWRPSGSVQERWAFTLTWAGEMITQVIASQHIDEARVAAGRLAHERG